MKKFVFLLSLIFTFTGCSLFGLVDDKDSLSGVLTGQETSDEYPGTHLLTDEDGEVYALNSTALNLSSQQYLGNEVQLQVEYDDDTEMYSVSGISVVEVLEKEDGKANWIPFMDQDVGVKLKYYDNWELAEGSSPMFLSPVLDGKEDTEFGRDIVQIKRFENEKGLSVEEYVKENPKDALGSDSALADFQISDAKIGLSQQSAKKYETEGLLLFFLERDEYIYRITYASFTGDVNTKNTFYEMLLEFQFVPFSEKAEEDIDVDDEFSESDALEMPEDMEEDTAPVEVAPVEAAPVEAAETSALDYDFSSYSEFESLPYHFSAKYPAGWYYAGASGSEDGVLHKYGFSDEEVSDDNEFASLKVLSGDLPSGTKVTLPNGSAVKQYKGGDVYFYVEVGDRLYSVQGSKDLEAVLEHIAASITSVES
jgi:hypothetical protein